MAPKNHLIPSEAQSTTAAGQVNDKGFFVLGFNGLRVLLI